MLREKDECKPNLLYLSRVVRTANFSRQFFNGNTDVNRSSEDNNLIFQFSNP